jgi:two-component system nitrate/nitrite response regulator NarL
VNKSAKEPIRIILLDNHVLVRAGMSLIIESQPDMQVVAQAGNLNEALDLIAEKKPDIILIEFDDGAGFNFEVLPDLIKSWSKARMILVTGSNDSEISLRAVNFGVVGVVLKTQPPEILLKAIRKVHQGEVWIEHSLIASLVTQSIHGKPGKAADPKADVIQLLSKREREVIQFIGHGLKNKQIAEHLCICETTVRHHLTSIYSKLGVADRLELLVFAQRHHLTQYPSRAGYETDPAGAGR